VSERDPFNVYRYELTSPENWGVRTASGRYVMRVFAEDLQLLLDEHDELATMQAYCTSCRNCAKQLDDQVNMEQYEDEIVESGWGWQ